MILSLKITKEQRQTLLNVYPSIKFFVEKAISNATNQIIKEKFYITDEGLREHKERLALNGCGPNRKRIVTQETKDKIRKALKGKHTGWHPFPETIEKIRLANIGKHSGPNLKSRGQKRTEETKRKMSLARIGNKYKKRAKVESN